ncbi:hypothetical protein [Rhodoluna sp. KAS3]|uniref:hypothetical protein n=1 Tax=Rhodoluna sp. KAS3 TaxID=942880 RepID=UPI00222FDD8C|nr:hypothetical protein [Rhodoluna sp. KAS3]BDS48827.1 hypothetical protein RKAS3_04040 [Rhodoluna sp. KAS3]
MIDWFYSVSLAVSVVSGIWAVALGLFKRKPSLFSLVPLALVQVLLVIQLAISISLVVLGERAKQDTVEFFAYLIVALMVPLAAGFWALIERSKWSTVVIGVGALTVAVMLVRMQQIWLGY